MCKIKITASHKEATNEASTNTPDPKITSLKVLEDKEKESKELYYGEVVIVEVQVTSMDCEITCVATNDDWSSEQKLTPVLIKGPVFPFPTDKVAYFNLQPNISWLKNRNQVSSKTKINVNLLPKGYKSLTFRGNNDNSFTCTPVLDTKSTECKTTIFECYCNRDFTEGELKELVAKVRDTITYTISVIEGRKEINKKFPLSNYLKYGLFNRNNETRTEYRTEIVPESDRAYKNLASILNTIFSKYKINSCIQKIHFLSQMFVETRYMTMTIELDPHDLDYDPYRGRGFFHLTNKSNYELYDKYSNRLKDGTNDFKITTNYSKVSTNLNLAGDTAGWFWSIMCKAAYTAPAKKMKYSEILNKTLNDIALYEDKYIEEISMLLNGGVNALKERKTAYSIIKNALKYHKCEQKK